MVVRAENGWSRLADATALAFEIHAAQFRKGTSIPYISHLLAVSAMVLEFGGDEEQACTGMLHDSVEDGGAHWQAHLEHEEADALLVSAADKLHNARAVVSALHTHGPAMFSRFNAGQQGTIWYYAAMAAVFDRRLPGPLSRELSAAVGQMRLLAAAQPV